jgi:hypothetical protein
MFTVFALVPSMLAVLFFMFYISSGAGDLVSPLTCERLQPSMVHKTVVLEASYPSNEDIALVHVESPINLTLVQDDSARMAMI